MEIGDRFMCLIALLTLFTSVYLASNKTALQGTVWRNTFILSIRLEVLGIKSKFLYRLSIYSRVLQWQSGDVIWQSESCADSKDVIRMLNDLAFISVNSFHL